MGACYGIDLSGQRLVVVKTSRSRKGVEHNVVFNQAGPLDTALRAAIQAGAGTGDALTAAAIPIHESFTRWLQSPLASIEKARKVLPSLLDAQLPFPLETCVYDFVQIRRTAAGKVDALAVAAREADVSARLDALRATGVDPVILDHEALALWTQSVAEIPLERNAVRVVACLGADHAAIVIGRCPESGLPEFQSAHSVRMDIESLMLSPASPDEAQLKPLAARIQQILKVQLPNDTSPTIQWAWAGPRADREDRLRMLSAAIELPGEPKFMTHSDPSSFLARALATRALEDVALRCNLRSGSLIHPLEVQYRNRAKTRSAVAILVAGILLCGMNLGWRGLIAWKRQDLDDRVTALAHELAQTSRIPRGQEVLTAQRAIEQRAGLTAPFAEAFEPSLTVLLSNILRTAQKNRIALDSLSLRADSVSLRGTAGDWDRCGTLVRLLRDGGFTVAEPQRQDAGSDERVHFSIKGTKPKGAPAK